MDNGGAPAEGVTRRWFGRRPDEGGPSVEELRILTRQFQVTLRAARAKVAHNSGDKEIFDRIDTLLKKPPEGTQPFSWSDAYEIEQLLVLIYDENTLRTELSLRALEARGILSPDLSELYRTQAMQATQPGQSVVGMRAVLARLVNDLQWRYTVDEARRGYAKEITGTAAKIFVLLLVLFAGVLLASPLAVFLFHYTDAYLLPLAGLAGAWGAAFSMLTGLRRRLDVSTLDQLKLIRPRWTVWARCLIGFGAASILYFFLLGGLLGGTAFPVIEVDRIATPTLPITTPLPPKQLALLVVWCFIAGFLERLVPGLLTRTGQRLQSRAGRTRMADPESGNRMIPVTPAATPTGDGAGKTPETTSTSPPASGS